ncbi:hypothetical protein ACN26Z_00680 [Verrucosispora sp. WMMD703]|uniref:hypothetical protein n=1 Tax=Verrucosispora sp. WMMD703 TaxID=3403463 RepID=UPI003B92AB89
MKDGQYRFGAFELQVVNAGNRYLARAAAVRRLASIAVGITPERLPDFYSAELEAMSNTQLDQLTGQLEKLAGLFHEAVDAQRRGEKWETPRAIAPNTSDPHVNELVFRLLNAGTARTITPDPTETLCKSLLMLSVSDFELLIGKVASAIMHKVPDAVRGADATLTLAQLTQFGSVQAAVNYVIERRVEDLLRASLADWESWFGGFGVKFRDMTDHWPHFAEIFARRNLVVHNDGKANQQYLSRLRDAGWTDDLPEAGNMIVVDPAYLSLALDRMTAFAALLTTGCLLQIEKGSILPIAWLSGKVQEISESGHQNAVRTITTTILRTSRGRLSRQHDLDFRIRQWIAMRQLGEERKMRREVEAWDIGGLEPYYVHVRAVLLEKTEYAIQSTRDLLDAGKLTPLRIRLDPLYQGLRDSGALDSVILAQPPMARQPAEDPVATQRTTPPATESGDRGRP